jgi:hypothetical protein
MGRAVHDHGLGRTTGGFDAGGVNEVRHGALWRHRLVSERLCVGFGAFATAAAARVLV